MAGHSHSANIAARKGAVDIKRARNFNKLARNTNPFVEKMPASRRGGMRIQYLEPKLVAEVEFRRWPAGGLVQQASFKGLRGDKPAKHVVKEVPVAAP